MELQGTIDEVIAKELTIDLSSGNFYKEVDDETLQMALVAMYENIEGWNRRGVVIGESYPGNPGTPRGAGILS